MNKIKASNMLANTTVELRYIFGITKNRDGSIDEVLFNYKKEDGKLYWGNATVNAFGLKILEGKIIAYSGNRSLEDGEWIFKNLAIVTPCITEDSVILKTASDTDTINNLLSLPVYEIKTTSDKKRTYTNANK